MRMTALGITLVLVSSFPVSAQTPTVKTELVMLPGMSITATTSSGKMTIRAVDKFTRSYTWEGATRSEELQPRHERWYGSLGAYSPGAGDHWNRHNGITRGVLEEGQRHFKSVKEALAWIKTTDWIPHVYRDDGLYVGWGKTLERQQLNVDVWQIYVNGKKPTKLVGSSNKSIVVSYVKPASTTVSLVEAVRKNNYASVRRLLAKGADPNIRNAAGSPLVLVAAANGYRAVLAELLNAKAKPDVRNDGREGETALLRATNTEIIKLLLKHGADPNIAYQGGMLKGYTALFQAAMARGYESARVLLEHGAKADAAAADGNTPLHWAAREGSPALARLLLEHGAAVDAREWMGETPLMCSVSWWSSKPANRLAMVKLLVSKGANVNARLDETRLEYGRASFVGDQETTKRLEASGKLDKLNENGMSVLDMATDAPVIEFLKSKGAKYALKKG